MKKVTSFFKYRGYGGSLKINISTTVFIPKPHTPFQWEPQDSLEEIGRKQQLLARELRKVKQIKYSWHGYEMGLLEAVFSRGDRRLSVVIERAWEKGAKLDNMSERFSYDIWTEAFRESNIYPSHYANRCIAHHEALPWEHLSSGADKDFLIKEHEKAFDAENKI